MLTLVFAFVSNKGGLDSEPVLLCISLILTRICFQLFPRKKAFDKLRQIFTSNRKRLKQRSPIKKFHVFSLFAEKSEAPKFCIMAPD